MMRTMLALSLTLAFNHADCGTVAKFGGLFPVIEKDIREIIFDKLSAMEKSGEMQIRQKEIISKVQKQIDRPIPSKIDTTTKAETFYVDPSIKVNQDIYNHDGILVARAGDSINPFKSVQYSKALIFFNADDSRQVEWVKHEYQKHQHVKFILTGGSVIDAQHIFGRVYFDLHHELSSKLHLLHVPSVVVQEGLLWKITEGAIS